MRGNYVARVNCRFVATALPAVLEYGSETPRRSEAATVRRRISAPSLRQQPTPRRRL